MVLDFGLRIVNIRYLNFLEMN